MITVASRDFINPAFHRKISSVITGCVQAVSESHD